jgi:hypothetical protein
MGTAEKSPTRTHSISLLPKMNNAFLNLPASMLVKSTLNLHRAELRQTINLGRQQHHHNNTNTTLYRDSQSYTRIEWRIGA